MGGGGGGGEREKQEILKRMHLEIINKMNTASLSHGLLSTIEDISFEIYRGHLRFFILRTFSLVDLEAV